MYITFFVNFTDCILFVNPDEQRKYHLSTYLSHILIYFRKMKFLCILALGSVLMAVTSSKNTPVDPSILNNIFPTPPTPSPGFEPTTKGIEDVSISLMLNTVL